jgi:hypothetical protein
MGILLDTYIRLSSEIRFNAGDFFLTGAISAARLTGRRSYGIFV